MKKITGYIQIYSIKARERIIEAGKKFLVNAGIEYVSDELFSCADELIKNAVKSNYKYLLIRDKIKEILKKNNPGKSPENIKKEIDDIVKVQESFDHIANDILSHFNISLQVREILDEESKLLKIKNKVYHENRKYTEDEKKIISDLPRLNYIRKRIKETDTKIILKIQSDNDFIYIEITNTAPILTKDLNRIYNKREEHKKCKDEGREHEFFINNLDTSESGFGLGYAKIDSIISSWGLDPDRLVTIISSINTTVMLTLPVAELKKS